MPPFSGGFSANLLSDFSIPANPLSMYFCSTSRTVVSNPAIAETCAMPEPISPQPRTPTFLISIRFLSRVSVSFTQRLTHPQECGDQSCITYCIYQSPNDSCASEAQPTNNI